MTPKILIFDNYDSFTYNLVHAIYSLGYHDLEVYRNDKITLDEIERFDKIVLSPGPGIPEEAGLLLPVIRRYAASKSILGVCLGQQAIAQAFGGSLINLKSVLHGISTPILVKDETEILFQGLPSVFEGGRYHSWVVDPENLPACLHVTALDNEGQIMALSHKQFDVKGVQFHPESVLTPMGEKIISNWLTSNILQKSI
ncbi:MAG: aminodeoxychorismate/anthranilate synthase component II [Bacteroidales bacterium]|nr:aminodeoxychorismate/anthranilate synthase component II [Bacteroidales bacterium]